MFLLIQTVLIAVLVLHYNYSSNAAAGFIAVFAAIFYALVGGVTPVDVLWSLQAVSVPIMFAGKVFNGGVCFGIVKHRVWSRRVKIKLFGLSHLCEKKVTESHVFELFIAKCFFL